MITIINTELGNLQSIYRMLLKLEFEVVVTSESSIIKKANKIILPGVGHYKKGMEKLNQLNLVPEINSLVKNNKIPILGICLGMQLLFEKSEEGKINGLGLLKGGVKLIKPQDKSYKVPHMGWNTINVSQKSRLFCKINNPRFYFVHSYKVIPEDEKIVSSYVDYGDKICSSVEKGNIFGVQFHPEKSHKFGLQLLRNFGNLNA
tara:strand:+ start:1073 stop:1684 length:612 start_codon:yes stop_codon:yes gene_type:complete